VYLGWITVGLASPERLWRCEAASAHAARKIFIVLGVVAAVLALGRRRGRGRSGSFWLVALRHTGARAGLIRSEFPSLHGALEPCAGAARSHGLRGVASPLRHSRTAVTIADDPSARRVLRRQVSRWRAAAFPVPPVYKASRRPAMGAVLSLPDYARTDLWFWRPNYHIFSTAHWHPVVNGDWREFPPQFIDIAERMKRFPDPSAAETMRTTRRKLRRPSCRSARREELLAPAGASADFGCGRGSI
jgi:hypothetical protein